ncbi:MAG: PAS domain S-box protein [Chitinophagaceae bacterium]|nr:PAS domain S-box protein [Chitinophagaceae bacterium]
MPNWLHTEFDEFSFFEMSPDLVCVANKEGFFKRVNPAVIEKLGYTQEELFARPISTFIHPEDQDLTRERRTKLIKGQVLQNFENRYLAKNGDTVWLAWTSIYFPEREVVFAIAKDVTERKTIEQEIEEKYKKFKGLASHFKTSIERDRKYFATELHEELAQLASVVKMDIDWINSHNPELPATSRNRLEHAVAISNLLVDTIRRISFSISPNMLDDLGLNATLEWHCREFSILNGIPCHFEAEYDETDLPHEVKIDFFRVCQEAMTNVMYHAEANNVWISIKEEDGKITLTITDDGKGFVVDQQEKTAGLTRMRERVGSINGELGIESEEGRGTRVWVEIVK